MNKIWVIAKRDFVSYFVSPVAYIVIAVFLVISGFFFWQVLSIFAYREFARDIAYNVELRVLISNMAVILLFASPMMTMRLFAEEKKLGTMELLITSPVTSKNIALGKFLAACLLFAVLCIITLQYPIFLMIFGNPDVGPMFSSYLGFFLIGLAYLSIGLFASSVTENQIAAYALSFGILLMLWVIGWAAENTSPIVGNILSSLSLMQHLESFTKGVIDIKDVFYYLSLTIAFLTITVRKLEWKRW